MAFSILPPGQNDSMMRIIGIIAILFGGYRLYMYRMNKKKYKTLSRVPRSSNNTDDDK